MKKNAVDENGNLIEIEKEDDLQSKQTEEEKPESDESTDGEEKEVKEVPRWLAAEEDESEEDESEKEKEAERIRSNVPVKKFVAVKKKLRGEVAERDDRIEKLEAQVAQIDRRKPTTLGDTQVLKRPRIADYDDGADDESYHRDLENYQDAKFAERSTQHTNRMQNTATQVKVEQDRKAAVDAHYERAQTLLDESGMDSEVFRQADSNVRTAVNQVLPTQPGFVDPTDVLISNVGDGSEKVMTYLGRNPKELAYLQSLLRKDPSGFQAAVFLGETKTKLTKAGSGLRSKTPKPAPIAQGDATPKSSGDMKRKYDAVHKKDGGGQEAWEIRAAARKAGVDTSDW